jgi:hypothetical protein
VLKAPATGENVPFPIVYDESKTTWASFKAKLATRPLGGLGAESELWKQLLASCPRYFTMQCNTELPKRKKGKEPNLPTFVMT